MDPGVSVAVCVALLYETVAAIALPPGSRNSNVVASIDDEFIASLNVAVTVVLAATPVAPLAGVTAVTTGGVVSAPVVVVNDHDTFALIGLPGVSFTRGSTAPPLTVAV